MFDALAVTCKRKRYSRRRVTKDPRDCCNTCPGQEHQFRSKWRDKFRKGATALVVELAMAFEKVQRSAVWKWTMYFDFPQRALRVLCVCVILQDLYTKPVTQQCSDRLRPPLGLVMKTRGNDDENSAPMQTWARHLRHIGHLRPTTLVCSLNRTKLCSVYVPREDECGWATHLTHADEMVRHMQCVHGVTRVCILAKICS